MDNTKQFKNIDEYLANFSGDTKSRLKAIRKTIKDAVPPKAIEKISYGIPTYYLNGNLVHFAAYKNHIGFYPGSVPIHEFKDKLESYKTSKGTVQFPIDKPLPLELIKDMVVVCVARNQTKSKK